MWPLQQAMPKDLVVLNIRAAPPEMVTAFAEGKTAVPATVQWDSWQLGLLVYELALGAPLFDLDLPVQFVQMMLTNQSPLPWEVSEVRAPFTFDAQAKLHSAFELLLALSWTSSWPCGWPCSYRSDWLSLRIALGGCMAAGIDATRNGA